MRARDSGQLRHVRHATTVVTGHLLLRVHRLARPRWFRPFSAVRAAGVHQLFGRRKMGSRPLRLAQTGLLGAQFRRPAGCVVRGRVPGTRAMPDRVGHNGTAVGRAGRHADHGPEPDRRRAIVAPTAARSPAARVHVRRSDRQNENRPAVQTDGRVSAHLGQQGIGRGRWRHVHVRQRSAPKVGLPSADDVRTTKTDPVQRRMSRDHRASRRELRPLFHVPERRLRVLQ